MQSQGGKMYKSLRLLTSSLLIVSFFPLLVTVNAANDSSSLTQFDEYVFRRSWGGEGGILNFPNGVEVGPDGRVYIANDGLNRVTVYNPNDGSFNNFGYNESGNGLLLDVTGVEVDEDGNIFVTSFYSVIKFNAEFDFILQWGGVGNNPGQFNFPTGITLSNTQLLYVADYGNNRIQVFDTNGNFVNQWGSSGSENGEFDCPNDVAIDSEGNVYITDSGNNRIQKFTSGGDFILQWGANGNGDGEFIYPMGIEVDDNDSIYVTDFGNARVQKFDKNGNYISQFGSEGSQQGQLMAPYGIAITNDGNLIVTDQNHRIQEFTPLGESVYIWGVPPSEAGQFNLPFDVVVNSNNEVIVADTQNFRIQMFNSDGTFIRQWGSWGDEPGDFKWPISLALDLNDNIYVLDNSSNRVQMFSSDGTYVTSWGSEGEEPGEFFNPNAIAVQANEYVYVADGDSYENNHRILIFDLEGNFISEWALDFYPYGIDVDNNGNVYITDYSNKKLKKYNQNGELIGSWDTFSETRNQWMDIYNGIDIDNEGNIFVLDSQQGIVVKFSPQGDHLVEWFGGEGNATGKFNNPNGIAVDNEGNLVIADTCNQRIQVFDKNQEETNFYSTFIYQNQSSALASENLLINGSFEATPPLIDWTYGGSLPVSLSNHAFEGVYSLALSEEVSANPQGQGQAWAHTTFNVPSNWSKPTLSFSYNLFVNDNLQLSDFYVEILDGVALNHLETVLLDGYDEEGKPTAGTDMEWKTVTFDLSAYKGQPIRLQFYSRNRLPQALGIWAFVDAVSVTDNPITFDYSIFLPLLNK